MLNISKQKDIEMILGILDKQIKKHVKQTVLDERDDLTQDMKIKIIERVGPMLDEKVPNFIEFVKKV